MNTTTDTQTNETDGIQQSDAELMERFRKAGDQKAFEALVRRHFKSIHSRFARRTGNDADADDLTQKLWIRVIENIDSYDDSGRFPNYIATIARNLLTDHWRKKGVRDAVDVDWPEDDEKLSRDPNYQTRDDGTENKLTRQHAIKRLVKEFIPNLPVEQRTIYLLRHESEHWESKRRMGWEHLAELNGIDTDLAWSRFDQARRNLLAKEEGRSELQDSEEACIFFVWTQAQRPGKQYSFTESDFAEMLSVPVNTLKTRYRTAVKQLAQNLHEIA